VAKDLYSFSSDFSSSKLTFDDHSGVKPLAFQDGGIPSLVFVLSRARKKMRM
jgi:hypothetical protein